MRNAQRFAPSDSVSRRFRFGLTRFADRRLSFDERSFGFRFSFVRRSFVVRSSFGFRLAGFRSCPVCRLSGFRLRFVRRSSVVRSPFVRRLFAVRLVLVFPTMNPFFSPDGAVFFFG